jgi:hypothetical protein
VHFRAMLRRERRSFLVKPLKFGAADVTEAFFEGVADRAHASHRREPDLRRRKIRN